MDNQSLEAEMAVSCLSVPAHLAGGDDRALCLPVVAAQLPHLHRALDTELQAAARDGRHLLGQHVLGGGAALGRLQGHVGGGVGVALALGEGVTTGLD